MIESRYTNFFIKLAETLPLSVDELSPRQFRKCVKILWRFDKLDTSKKIMILDVLLRPRIKYLILRLRLNFLRDSQVLEIAKFAEYMFSDDLATQVNLIPSFKHRGTTYHGPKNRMNNKTFGEFVTASDYLTLYHNSKNKPELLDKFIATIYRPEGDHSIESDAIIERAAKIKKLRLSTKLAIYHNYLLMINYLSGLKKMKYVFSKAQVKIKPKEIPLWLDLVSEWVRHEPERYQPKFDLHMMTALFALNKVNDPRNNKEKTYDRNNKTK